MNDVLKVWKRKCRSMGNPVGDEELFILLFADDQIQITQDEDNISYMVRKLIEEYKNGN